MSKRVVALCFLFMTNIGKPSHGTDKHLNMESYLRRCNMSIDLKDNNDKKQIFYASFFFIFLHRINTYELLKESNPSYQF